MVCLCTHQQSQAVPCFSETSSQTLHKKQKQKQRWSRNIQSEAMLLRTGKLNCQRSLVALTSLTTIPFMAMRACLKELMHEEREWKMLCWEHVSSLMTFYPDMRMMLSGWSEKNVFQDLVKQRTWFPEATSSEIWWLVRFKKKKLEHASPSQQQAEILNMLLTDPCSIFLNLLLADKLPCTVLTGIML